MPLKPEVLAEKRRKPRGTGHLKSEPGLVRCLGPGKEHTFRSPDRVGTRLCPRCKQAMAASYYRVYGEPAASPN